MYDRGMKAIAVVSCLLVSSIASAQETDVPVRDGFFGGLGAFGGNISCNGSDCGGFRSAAGGSLHLGYLFNAKVGLLADVWAMTSDKGNASVTFAVGTLNLRWWAAPSFWLQGGLGNGHAVVEVFGFSGRGDDVPVVELTAGLELVRGRSWAIDLAVKLAQGSSTDPGAMAADNVQTGRMVGLGAHLTLFSTR